MECGCEPRQLLHGLVIKNPLATAADARDLGLTPGSRGFLEKEMVTHCSVLAWRIPRTEEPGGPQPMRSQRVGHN